MAGISYIVKPGDNLWNIARAHGVDFDALKQANPELALRAPPYGLNPGDRVNIPNKPAGAQPPPATDATASGCTQGCPPMYLLEVRLVEPTGQTDGGTNDDGFDYSGDLAPHRPSPILGWIGVFVDVTGDSYAKKVVPKSFDYLATSFGSTYFELSAAQHAALKNLYLWSGDAVFSFFVNKGPGESFAKMRLDIPRRLGVESAIAEHPVSRQALPKGSKKLRFEVMLLNSPVVYMVREINRNARSDDIPTTAAGWADRAQEGQPWDYKHPIRRIWSDKVRLGNHAGAVDTGAFSNFHYGYVAAAGGLTIEATLSVGNWGQRLSNLSNLSIPKGDPPEDVFATRSGHEMFVANNGPILLKTAKVPTTIPLVSITVNIPVHQEIEVDLTRSRLQSFLLQYQSKWNANL